MQAKHYVCLVSTWKTGWGIFLYNFLLIAGSFECTACFVISSCILVFFLNQMMAYSCIQYCLLLILQSQVAQLLAAEMRMGCQFLMGHMDHGSRPIGPRPIKFLRLQVQSLSVWNSRFTSLRLQSLVMTSLLRVLITCTVGQMFEGQWLWRDIGDN